MDLYVDDQTVAQLTARVGDGSPPAALAELAWHLRQRDGRRASALVDRATAAIGKTAPPELAARLKLIRGELATLNADLDAAADWIGQARAGFEAAGDVIGLGDCYLVDAQLGHVQGDYAVTLAKAASAHKAYRLAEDATRLNLSAAWAAVASTQACPDDTTRWIQVVEESNDPVLQLLLGLVKGLQLFNSGNHAHAGAQFAYLASQAEGFGLFYLRIRIGIGVAASCANIDDRDNAQAWAEQTLAIARRHGWPLPLVDALSLVGNLCREAGQLDRSLALLKEALDSVAVAPNSRGAALVRCYLGHAELAANLVERALASAESARTIAAHLSNIPIETDALTLAARACNRLGRFDDATALAEQARSSSEHHHLPSWQIDSLRVLAEIQSARAGGGASPEAIHLLEEALRVAEHTASHMEQIAILESLSHAHETAGDLVRALFTERRARTAQRLSEAKRTSNRMATLELRHSTELSALAAEHQHELQAIEAERAREYESSRQVLENLGRIGREITANLDVSSVLHTLVAHLGKLVEASFVGISVLESNGKLMIRRGVEDGRPMPERRVSIDDPNSKAAQCARERREILSESRSGQRSSAHVPGTREMHASWFGPLVVSEELVGVLTIQSSSEHAYGEHEQLIFRTLSAYVAVAVANARVYTRLGEQHARLTEVEAEMRRLATTDALTGIPNRRQFLSTLGQETRRSRRNGQPMAVIMADIDYFKQVNDTLGHAAGDLVLSRVARILQNNKRGADTVGRLGGEEFAVLLPETDAAHAAEVADRLRALIEAERINWDGVPVTVTMSFGCADLAELRPDESESGTIEALLQAADRALYRAKHAGRNRTVWVQDGQDQLYSPDVA